MCEPSSNATGPILFKLSQNLHFRPEKVIVLRIIKIQLYGWGEFERKRMFLTTFIFLLITALACPLD